MSDVRYDVVVVNVYVVGEVVVSTDIVDVVELVVMVLKSGL